MPDQPALIIQPSTTCVSIFQPEEIQLFTDAAPYIGFVGFGVYLGSTWFSA